MEVLAGEDNMIAEVVSRSNQVSVKLLFLIIFIFRKKADANLSLIFQKFIGTQGYTLNMID